MNEFRSFFGPRAFPTQSLQSLQGISKDDDMGRVTSLILS